MDFNFVIDDNWVFFSGMKIKYGVLGKVDDGGVYEGIEDIIVVDGEGVVSYVFNSEFVVVSLLKGFLC